MSTEKRYMVDYQFLKEIEKEYHAMPMWEIERFAALIEEIKRLWLSSHSLNETSDQKVMATEFEVKYSTDHYKSDAIEAVRAMSKSVILLNLELEGLIRCGQFVFARHFQSALNYAKVKIRNAKRDGMLRIKSEPLRKIISDCCDYYQELSDKIIEGNKT